MTSEEKKIQELPDTSSVSLSDQIIVETEDGTKLADLAAIKKIMNANFVVENVEAMKSASFKEGEVCITLGYHTAGDGGGAIYKIVYEPTLVEDGGNVIYLLTSDVNRAKFISINNCVTPEQFGAVGNGKRDDSEAFKRCIASNYKIICRKGATYYVGGLPLTNDLFIDLNGASLVSNGRAVFKSNKTDTIYENICICNGFIRGASSSKAGLAVDVTTHTKGLRFENIIFDYMATSNSFIIGNHENAVIRNCKFNCISAGSDAIKINYSSYTTATRDSLTIDSCSFNLYQTPLQVRGKLTSYSGTVNNDVALDMVNIINTTASKGDPDGTGTFISVYGDCTVNVDRCRSYKFGTFVSTSGNLRNNISVSNVTANYVDTFISTSAGTDQVNSKISVSGTIVASASASSAQKCLFNILAGTLYLNTSAFQMDSVFKESLTTGTLSANYANMKIVDNSSVDSKDILSYTGTTASVDISSFGKISNLFIDLKSASGNVTTITGGVVGQVVKLVSSGNRTLVNNGSTLRLSASSIALSAYKSVTLKKIDNTSWAQI